MAGFLNNSQVFALTGAQHKHWQTFKRQIVVAKEPIRTLINSNPSSPFYGYGESSNVDQYEFTSVTGVFDAMITYNLDQKLEELEEVKNNVLHGKIRIKVEKEARDFIEDGTKTERIEFDNKSFNVITSEGVLDYLGLTFYVYHLESTL
jgi:antitoxin component YwqK of YwqJK toxin-antitoxin module